MTTAKFTLRDDFPPASYASWRALIDEELAGASFERKLVTRSDDGIELRPLYTRDDFDGSTDASGFPGAMPFTRGASDVLPPPAQELAQERAEPALEAARACLRDDLEHGVGRVHLRLDRAARDGMDGDDEDATSLVGVDGVALYSMADLDALFEGVALGEVAISLDAGANFLAAASGVIALLEHRGLAWSDAHVAFNADPLATLARDGRLPGALTLAFDHVAALCEWATRHMPRAHVLRVGTTPYHHAGATAAQDLGIALATGVAYLRALEARGIAPAAVAERMLFDLALGTRTFLAIAKLRAARRLWARVLEACGVQASRRGMTLHVETGKRVLAARDPWVNMLRNTVSCFAAIVGGAQIVTSAPFDAALGLPNALARRVARNTPIVLREEARLDRVVDPAGGSWTIETLTEQLAEKAWSAFQAIEARGGMVEALRSGWIASSLEAADAPRQRNLATRRDPLIGVSEFARVDEVPVERVEVSLDAVRRDVRARIERHRSQVAPDVALAGLRGPSGEPLVERAVAACRAGATFGQIAAALCDDASEHLEAPLTPRPYAAAYEALRDAADRHLADTGARPSVFLVNVGTLAQHNARTTYARGFFAAGGFAVHESESETSTEALAAAFQASGARIAVICSSDAVYAQHVAALAPALRRAGARTVILAGPPGEHEAAYRGAGVDRFIYVRCDVVEALRALLQEEGALP